jgi:hypothetical protein
MLSTLASHNEDIRKLIDKGYAVAIDSECLVIRDIPYLAVDKQLQLGAFVSKLIYVNEYTVTPDDHQMYFCGSHPYQIDGTPIKNLAGGEMTMPLMSTDLVVQRSFSCKPAEGYKGLFDKVENYLAMIAGPAMNVHNANPFTFRSVEKIDESVFHFSDTLTSRAEIGDLATKFRDDIIAIIGLGGTGSYLLDFMVKTPVKEIRAFDPDFFHVHNAYRSPGKLNKEEFEQTKAQVYQKRYEDFRSGLSIIPRFIDLQSSDDLIGVTFAFVCVDKGSARKEIFELLMGLSIPFIDVGMGLDRNGGPISGTVRTTYYSPETVENLLQKRLAPMHDLPDDVYRHNIQISELNALNASFAITKFKQLRGFYANDNPYYNMLFTVDATSAATE